MVARAVPKVWGDPLVLEVSLPPRKNSGYLIDRKRLALYGTQCAPAFRTYLAARAYFDRYGSYNGYQVKAHEKDGTLIPKGVARYPVIKHDDLWNLAFPSKEKAAYTHEGKRLRGNAAMLALLDTMSEDIHTLECDGGVRLLPPYRVSAETVSYTHLTLPTICSV